MPDIDNSGSELMSDRPWTSEPQEQRLAARTVCHYAADAGEAKQFLAMLGLTDIARITTPGCARCKQPMRNTDDYGRTLPVRDGMCGPCVNILRQRAQREARR